MKRFRTIMARAGRTMTGSPASTTQADADALCPHPMFKPRTYTEGIQAGAAAYRRGEPITAFERVGLDDYARGFRRGYFTHTALGTAPVHATGTRNVP